MTGYVYAIENADGLVKLGWSGSPWMRLASVRTHTASPSKLIGYLPATPRQELELHELCSGQRVHGEWFRKEGPVAAFISALPPAKPEPKKKQHTKRKAPVGFAQVRVQHGYSVADICRLVGVDKGTVSRWESGQCKITAERAIQIEREVGIPRDVLRPDLFGAS